MRKTHNSSFVLRLLGHKGRDSGKAATQVMVSCLKHVFEEEAAGTIGRGITNTVMGQKNCTGDSEASNHYNLNICD